MTELFDLTDRVAVVSGGCDGIGLRVALALAAAGADIVLAGPDADSCQDAVGKVRDLGRRAVPVVGDSANWSDNDRIADIAYAEFGSVDVLVDNVAGRAVGPPAPASSWETSESALDAILDRTVKGPFRLAAVIGPRMVASGGGSIVVIAPGGAADSPASEAGAAAALGAMTRAFAVEYAPTVRVNAIAAGTFGRASGADDDRKSAPNLLGRPGDPREIVGAALYLAGDSSSFTTGTVLRVDGGRL